MPTYDPNAKHNKILKDPVRVIRKSQLEGKTIEKVIWGEEVSYIRFKDDSLAEITLGGVHDALSSGLTLSDHCGKISARTQRDLGYITEKEYRKHLELKKEWEEKEKKKERKRRYKRLRKEFGPDLSEEEIEELIEMRDRMNEILDE